MTEPDALQQPEVSARQLTRQQIREVCDKFVDVQTRLDKATEDVRKEAQYKDKADFGTKVHKKLADGINALGEPDYQAEVSTYKSLEAQKERGNKPNHNPYGKLDTVRVDVLENRPEIKTVCVYDPKTGKSGLSLPRMMELATGVTTKYPGTRKIFVIEMRESRSYR